MYAVFPDVWLRSMILGVIYYMTASKAAKDIACETTMSFDIFQSHGDCHTKQKQVRGLFHELFRLVFFNCLLISFGL